MRLAIEAGVPIVPVVSIGGQETALFLSHGQRLSRALRLDRMFRLKVLPVSLSLPWIVNVGDFFGHLPLPAKITIQVIDPIDLHERFGREVDLDAGLRLRHRGRCRRPSTSWRPSAAFPSSAEAVRIDRSVTIDAPRWRVWDVVTDPANYLEFMEGLTRWDVEGEPDRGLGARYRMLIQVGSADVGGLIEVVEWTPRRRHGLELGDGHRPARPLAAERPRAAAPS